MTALLSGHLQAQIVASPSQDPPTYKTYRRAAAAALDSEAAREKAGDCTNAQNTLQVNGCLAIETGRTDTNYRAYVGAIRSLLSLDPPIKGKPDVAAEFDHAEELWLAYRESQCVALYDQYADGTIRHAMYGNCVQTVTRSHMHALNRIYGLFLTL